MQCANNPAEIGPCDLVLIAVKTTANADLSKLLPPLIRPETILLVGSLAIERYFHKRPLAELIGQRFEREGSILIPLPHPSGASRWLNALGGTPTESTRG